MSESWWVGLSSEEFYKAAAEKVWREDSTMYVHVQKQARPITPEKRRLLGKKGAAATWGTNR